MPFGPHLAERILLLGETIDPLFRLGPGPALMSIGMYKGIDER